MDVPSISSTEGSGTSRQQRGGTRYAWNLDNITSSTDTEIESTEKWYIVSSILLKANSLYLYECSIDPRWRTEGDVATIHIRSSEEPAFKKLLEFIHGCYAPRTSSNVSELSQVMVVAKRFRVSTCYDICEALLIRNYGSLEHPELLTLPLSVVLQLLQSNDLEVESEDIVYRFATEWGKKNHSTIRRRRLALNIYFQPLIRFRYMSNDMLTTALREGDTNFSFNSIYNDVAKARRYKTSPPDWLSGNAGARLAERAYKRKPLNILKKSNPRASCRVHLSFTRLECTRLVRSSPACSEEFEFDEGRFSIRVANTLADTYRYFGLALQIVRYPMKASYSCTASSKTKEGDQHVVTHTWELKVLPRVPDAYEDLFSMSWKDFIREDSPFFIDNKLYLVIEIEAIDLPCVILDQ
ncbi:BTB/POZ domain-containing protein At2g46260-like [Typha latifolia]|uniref:BTB/POZ domain-containing protein At2g46260-like n=1 Tax=Typha latifolia TaxID=4733 RepID=UPI003C2E0235